MSEPAIAIADAVVTALNAHPFAVPLQAARVYQATRVYIETNDLRTSVMPVNLESELDTRGEDEETHRIGIVLHRKTLDTTLAAIDPLVNLVRAVHDFCRGREFAGAVILKRRTTHFDYQELQRKQFVGYVELECQYFYTPPAEED
jgi:hypothetical protein